ncbi:hypothetical protein NPX13_g10611 [Xylaria arbuscula]|uniref:Uncharacterized protein n=1 Tax=Xylaria arbuscula TaxID=114810 RepID=A0A9W8N4G7_9PEZI|nr:hypothetical protein NPX13_g10611 [Xylaria arbuscula]
MGFRQASNPYEYEASPERSLARRTSISRKASKEAKEYEDRKRMPPPPPPRPKSTRPERHERFDRPEPRFDRPERPERLGRTQRLDRFEPPPPERPERIVLKPQPSSNMNTNRKSVVFDDDDLDDESTMYHNVLRRGSSVEYGSSPFKNRRQSFDATDSVFNYEEDDDDDLDEDDYFYEAPPRSRSRRRSSHIDIEDKMRDASRYQDNMGGPSAALTAEALRKARNGGSSRSTRSSISRDESEYHHTATTHTTRSSSGEDDITIKVSAGCVVEVGNVKIHSTDGGEVSVGRTGTSRAGSDRGTSIYGDERMIRSGRSRGRASSQSAYSRGLPAPGSYTPSPLYSQYQYSDEEDSSY